MQWKINHSNSNSIHLLNNKNWQDYDVSSSLFNEQTYHNRVGSKMPEEVDIQMVETLLIAQMDQISNGFWKSPNLGNIFFQNCTNIVKIPTFWTFLGKARDQLPKNI